MPFKNTVSAGGSRKDRINGFLATPGYIMLIMLLTVLSNVLALELVVYTLFMLTIIYVCILGDSLLPLMPVFICCYIAPSVRNNPGRYEGSVFQPEHGGIYLLCIAALAAAAVIYRVIRDRKQFFSRKYKLLSGMLVLAGAYLLNGLGSQFYAQNAPRSLPFALANIAAIILPYILLSGGVDWKNIRKDYLAWTGFGVGCALICEILWIYLSGEVIQDGIIQRHHIYTGWGMYNNIGAMLAMMIPFPFYLATKYHKGWIGTLTGCLFLIGIILTCSRGSILCGSGIYFLCVILMLYYANNRKANTLALILFMSSAAVLLLLFYRPLLTLFSSLLSQGLDPSNRDIIYRDGFQLYAKYPIFGGGFFSTEHAAWGWSTVESFKGFLPPRWHNTFVQLVASCGSVGLISYLFHRLQTVMLFCNNFKPRKIFAAASILVLLACSLFDCHFFNIGPALMYSMILAYAENR